MASELKAVSCTLTFPWANIRVQRLRLRGAINQENVTGSGNGRDSIFADGTEVRDFAFSGVSITDSFEVGTRSGTLKIDMTGDDSKDYEATVSLETWVIEADFVGGGAYRISGTGKVNGTLKRNNAVVT